MKSKWIKLLAMLFAASLVAAACGSTANTAADTVDGDDSAESDDGGDDGGDDAPADAQAALDEANARADEAEARADAAEAAGGGDGDTRQFAGEVVQITGPERSPEEWGAIEAALDPLEEELGATIIYTGSADWEAEINVQLAAGNPPDISIFPQPGKLADFARQGDVLEVPGPVQDFVAANWAPGAIEFGNVDGTQFGVPNKNDLKSLVWYRPEVFEAGGYEIPETYDEFRSLVATMIDDGITPLCVGIESGQATGWVFTDWVEDLLLRFEGPEVYDQWVTNEVPFSDERIVAIFDEIIELWNTDGAVFAAGGSIAATNHSAGNAEGLIDGDCAMVRQASFFSGFLPEGTSDQVDVFYFPALDTETRPVLGGGTLAGAFIDRPVVWEIMSYFASPEYANARQAAQQGFQGGEGALSGFNTANLNVDRDLWAPLEASFIGILQDAAIFRFDGSDLQPAEVGAGTFWTEATAVVTGERTTVEAAANIDASWPTGDEDSEDDG